MTTWHPLAPSEPIPGDHAVMEEAAAYYVQVAEDMATAITALDRIKGGGGIAAAVSLAVHELHDQASNVREHINRARDRYDMTQEALSLYADSHRVAQTEAESLRVTAVETQRALDAALDSRMRAERAHDDAVTARDIDGTPVPPSVVQWLADARAEVTRHRATIDQLKDDLETVKVTWRRAAEDAADGIDHAVENDGLQDSWWEEWGSDFFSTVSAWAGNIATALGVAALVLAWVPVVGQVLAVAALIVGAVALMADFMLVFHDEGSWINVVSGILGVVTFGAGYAIGKGVTTTATRAMTQGASRASRSAKRVRAPQAAARLEAAYSDVPVRAVRPAPHAGKYNPLNAGHYFSEGRRSFAGLRGRDWVANALGVGDSIAPQHAYRAATSASERFLRNDPHRPIARTMRRLSWLSGSAAPVTGLDATLISVNAERSKREHERRAPHEELNLS